MEEKHIHLYVGRGSVGDLTPADPRVKPTKDAAFNSREAFKEVMLKSQEAYRSARNVVMLANQAGDKRASSAAQELANMLDRAADKAHGLA